MEADAGSRCSAAAWKPGSELHTSKHGAHGEPCMGGPACMGSPHPWASFAVKTAAMRIRAPLGIAVTTAFAVTTASMQMPPGIAVIIWADILIFVLNNF